MPLIEVVCIILTAMRGMVKIIGQGDLKIMTLPQEVVKGCIVKVCDHYGSLNTTIPYMKSSKVVNICFIPNNIHFYPQID